MPTVNFDQFAPAPLTLTYGEHKYSHPAPSVAAAKAYLSFFALPKAVKDAEEITDPVLREEKLADLDKQLLAITGGLSLEEYVFGDGLYSRMVNDGLPAPVINAMANYAILYWITGEDVANEALLTDGNDTSGAVPKDQKVSRNGQNTGLVSQTKTESSPITVSRNTSNHVKAARKKKRNHR